MAKFSLTSKRTWKKILSISVATLMIAATVFGFVKLAKYASREKTTVSPSWEIGTINETTGKANSAQKTSLITSEAFNAYGLEIEVDFEANAKYQVFFYDSVGTMFKKSEELDEGSQFKVDYGCQVRVELIPDLTNDEDGQISWWEKWNYSRQITIRVKKNQTLEAKDFAEYALTDTTVFNSKVGQRVTLDNAVENWVEDPNISTYYVTNTGAYSAFYVKEFSIAKNATSFAIRLRDGKTVLYYGYDAVTGGVYGSNSEVPMKPADAVKFPVGATLYVMSTFGEGDANNTFIGLY